MYKEYKKVCENVIADQIEKEFRCFDLLTNGVTKPLCIDLDNPVFSWKAVHRSKGEKQSAYQVIVSSSLKNSLESVGDIWDSGKIMSDNSVSVEYKGKSLQCAKRYWWRVAVWDSNDQCSGYSEPCFFDTGLNKENWKAQYIWDGSKKTNHYTEFRKSFSVGKDVSYAKVFVFAHNEYKLFINDYLLGKGPARSNPETYGQYNAYDITDILKKGKNTFFAMAHWHGEWIDSGVNAKAVFLLQCEIDYSDGTHERIVTNDSWEAAERTPFIEEEPVFFGEAGGKKNRCAICYDGRIAANRYFKWKSQNGWKNAELVPNVTYKLYSQLVAEDKVQEILPPEEIEQKNDVWYVTFKHCICGYPRLSIKENKEGSKIRVQYYQLPDFSGEAGWDEYICAGDPKIDIFEPDFGHHSSFMALKIHGYSGTLEKGDVYAITSYTDAELSGDFQCSDMLLNDVYRMCVRSAVQNVQQGIISVDANREQSPWLADSWNIGIGILYNCRNTMLIDKIIKDYAGEQMKCGDFYACSPAKAFRIPEWSMYWPMLLWQQYLFSGNKQILYVYYPHLCRFIDWISGYEDSATHLIDPPDGSWDNGIRFSDYADGSILNGGLNIATNSQFCENLRIAASIAGLTGHESDRGRFARKYEQVKEAINIHLVNEEKAYLTKFGEKEAGVLGSCWPLRFDLVPDENKTSLRSWILAQSEHLFGGYGGDTYYNAMFKLGGMGKFLVKDFNRYNKMLESNHTNWETWEHGEYNHAWTSYPAYILLKYIVGIEPVAGGFSEYKIKPHTEGLTFAKGVIPTLCGDIRVEWYRRENGLEVNCDIPFNTKAKLYFDEKIGRKTRIMEHNDIVWDDGKIGSLVPGVFEAVRERGEVQVCMGAGKYKWSVGYTDVEV